MARDPLRGDRVCSGSNDAVSAVDARLDPRNALAPVRTAGAGSELGSGVTGGDVGVGDGLRVGRGERQAGEGKDDGETHLRCSCVGSFS